MQPAQPHVETATEKQTESENGEILRKKRLRKFGGGHWWRKGLEIDHWQTAQPDAEIFAPEGLETSAIEVYGGKLGQMDPGSQNLCFDGVGGQSEGE